MPLQHRQQVVTAPFPYDRSAAEAPTKHIYVGSWQYGGCFIYARAVYISAGETYAAVGSHTTPCRIVGKPAAAVVAHHAPKIRTGTAACPVNAWVKRSVVVYGSAIIIPYYSAALIRAAYGACGVTVTYGGALN